MWSITFVLDFRHERQAADTTMRFLGRCGSLPLAFPSALFLSSSGLVTTPRRPVEGPAAAPAGAVAGGVGRGSRVRSWRDEADG